jgi:hypothetical protein
MNGFLIRRCYLPGLGFDHPLESERVMNSMAFWPSSNRRCPSSAAICSRCATPSRYRRTLQEPTGLRSLSSPIRTKVRLPTSRGMPTRCQPALCVAQLLLQGHQGVRLPFSELQELPTPCCLVTSRVLGRPAGHDHPPLTRLSLKLETRTRVWSTFFDRGQIDIDFSSRFFTVEAA